MTARRRVGRAFGETRMRKDNIKLCPKGLASKRKLRIRYLRIRLHGQGLCALALTCLDLPWLALTLFQIKFARNLKQGFYLLVTQPKSTQVYWPIISQWNREYSVLTFFVVAATCVYSTQVSTQVQLASPFDYLPVRLTRAYDMVGCGWIG